MNTTYSKEDKKLSVVVIGASGDLAMRKIFPALFSLYTQDLLPDSFQIIGYARSQMSNEVFREKIIKHLSCRYVPEADCAALMDKFLAACVYKAGGYDDAASYTALGKDLDAYEGGAGNRIFYMSIPPFLFLDVARALANAGLVSRDCPQGWSRVVVEKPFGSDRESSDELTDGMAEVFTEGQTYRIDHYLGKEVIQNLMVLRFANTIFDPIWNRACIHDVRISWMENLSLEGRAGYFDQYGIMRDVMQNHLLQILALVAMEQPITMGADDVRNEKVKVLRAIPTLTRDNLVTGQYTAGVIDGSQQFGYLQEDGVPEDSITDTYAAAVLQINNRRWHGVPFCIRAGKGLANNMTEIRIRFQETPGNIFSDQVGKLSQNELIIRVQPDAGIRFRIRSKVPGLGIKLDENDLDLRYESAYGGVIPDAYESLILDVVKGDKSLFIRSDELAVAWDIFTPVLHELADIKRRPEPYIFGSHGPAAAGALAARYGVRW